MDQKGYYKILNLQPIATNEQINDAYFELARKWHPDKNKSELAKQKFPLIQEAYNILSDSNTRAKYDNPLQFSNTTFNFGNGNTRVIRMSNINKILKETVQTRYDYEGKIYLSFETLYKGTKKLEPFSFNGKQTLIEIIIPPGCKEGNNIYITKNGLQMKFTIYENKHAVFTRNDHDLYMNYTLSLKDYVNGFKIEIPLLNGETKVIQHKYGGGVINCKTQPLKVQGYGMPYSYTGKYGDLYINFTIQLPEKIDFQ